MAKQELIREITKYIDYFSDFGKCNNSLIVSGTLDYLRDILKKEKNNLNLENRISDYVFEIKKVYKKCGGNPEVFIYLNLNSLENKFRALQNYISTDLKIYPRLY